jgi:hypothetical protein
MATINRQAKASHPPAVEHIAGFNSYLTPNIYPIHKPVFQIPNQLGVMQFMSLFTPAFFPGSRSLRREIPEKTACKTPN